MYALFAIEKLVKNSQLVAAEVMLAQRSDEQLQIATQKTKAQMEASAEAEVKASKVKEKYNELAQVGSNSDSSSSSAEENAQARARINAEIAEIESEYRQKTEKANREACEVALKEHVIEQEVKRLETVVSAIKAQLQNLEQAESQGIQQSTPKYNGLS